jgi:hypothetical protein
MVHANAQERGSLIAGLRALADFLEGNSNVPSPCWADVMVFPADGNEVDRIAALIGAQVDDRTAAHGHYITARRFGPVEYRAVFIPAESRGYQEAKDSYTVNIVPDAREEV